MFYQTSQRSCPIIIIHTYVYVHTLLMLYSIILIPQVKIYTVHVTSMFHEISIELHDVDVHACYTNVDMHML